jgi:2-polyprenyl-6-methoxyphenol hydroxylase-like FAD-dependent oxidoreductase
MTSTNGKRALVVGLGVSGIATAICLRKAGWEPVIVERAPGRRRGGYFIGLFEPGMDAAQRIGILDDIHDRYPSDCVSYTVDRAGNHKPGVQFPPGVRPRVVLRGDVERAAFEALPPDVEIRYATTPTRIEQDASGVDVTLEHEGTSVTERFDLVVGTDGLRSTVRRLVFGPHEKYLHRLGYMIAAFTVPEPIGGYTGNEYVALLEPDRSLWVVPFKDHPPSVLFSYRCNDIDAQFHGRPADRVRAAYGPEPYGRLLGEALDALDAADTYLFDSVEQVRMDTWSRGRVVLLGDSAWCPSLYSGMGAGGGLIGADLLGAMLAEHPDDVDAALRAWEQTLRPAVESWQKLGVEKRFFFTPGSRLGVAMRPVLARTLRVPLIYSALARMNPGPAGKDLRREPARAS